MGRKYHAPRRGSLAFGPRKRAARPIARIRDWPKVEAGPKLLAFGGYKAGMTYACVIETNPNSPNYGKDVACAVTIIDAPPMIACAIRAYERTDNGLRTLGEVWAKLPKNLLEDLARVFAVPKTNFDPEKRLAELERKLDRIAEIRVVLCAQPRKAGVGKKKPELMEVKIGGGTVKEQFEYAKNLLGKEIGSEEVFREGQYVDIISITKGKGWAGPVKRFGIKLLTHKARKGRRKPGTLGPWHPAHVLYTVPRAGQLGYHQRTEYRKLILRIGSNGEEVTPRGGFPRYGVVRGSYILVQGSVAGHVKRFVKLRYSMRASEEPEVKPRITFIMR